MQIFANVGSQPERVTSKSSGRVYWQMRVAESHRGLEREPPTWYTVRIMKESDPQLAKGDFAKVTGRLKTDFYLSREGKPTGTLLIIAFEAAKISKPVTAGASAADRASPPKAKAPELPGAEVATPVVARADTANQAMLVDWAD
jgi:single-stranded DNA-binding protein